MTPDEAQKLADVILKADGGCVVCVRGLAQDLSAAFPEYVWSINEDDYYERHADLVVSVVPSVSEAT